MLTASTLHVYQSAVSVFRYFLHYKIFDSEHSLQVVKTNSSQST